MAQELYGRLFANPRFQELARRRARLAWTLSAIVLIVYYSFILVVGFAPEWLGTPLADGSTLTLGIPLGVAIIVLAWVLTGVYVHRANKDFDKVNEQILEEAQQ